MELLEAEQTSPIKYTATRRLRLQIPRLRKPLTAVNYPADGKQATRSTITHIVKLGNDSPHCHVPNDAAVSVLLANGLLRWRLWASLTHRL